MSIDWAQRRIHECPQIVDQLLAAPKVPFNDEIRSKLPSEHGLYAIYQKDAADGDVLRAGRTKTAGGGLRQRIYQNHLMGNQKGNLRSQLVAAGTCADFEQTKVWIQQNALVQFVIVGDDRQRAWAEYFMLSILRPKHLRLILRAEKAN
jgi:hypothetical protein